MLYFVLCIIFVFNTIKFTLELSSVDDWLFTEDAEEEKEEADDDDFCISIVVFELITFS